MPWILILLLLSFITAEQLLPDIVTAGDRTNFIDRVSSPYLPDAYDIQSNPYPCNIRRISYTDLSAIFPPFGLVPSLYIEPIIITTESSYNYDFVERTKQTNILHQFPPDFHVRLSSSNSYSSHRRTISLTQYLQEAIVEHDLSNKVAKKSNKTWYLFGETFSDEWKRLLDHFILPPCQKCTREFSSLSFGLGGFASGVQWHFHGPGFSEVIHGSKHWILFPPTYSKDDIPFYDNPSYTSFLWMILVD